MEDEFTQLPDENLRICPYLSSEAGIGVEVCHGDVSADTHVEDLLHELAPQVLGILTCHSGQFAEELVTPALEEQSPEGQDTLALLFLCCHPAPNPMVTLNCAVAVAMVADCRLGSIFLKPWRMTVA
jgi:hypothetical protein